MADRAEERLMVAASAQACFDALVDYEGMPEWQSTVRSATVLSRDARGRGREVAWEIDAKLRIVRYTLRYDYDEPRRIGSTFVEGDLKSVAGEYLMEDRGADGTLVRFRLEIDPGLFVPGRVKKMLGEQVMRRSVEDLKARVESGAR